MITELCTDVINSFKELNACLQAVVEHVCVLDKDLPAWFQAPPELRVTSNNMRQQACNLLCQLEYLDQQNPKEILVGAGLIAASLETISTIQALNIAKQNFKTAILRLKAAKITTNYAFLAENFEKMLAQRDTNLAVNLTRLGLARLHLKQCYRKVPFFLNRPNKVAWTWANTRSIKRISIPQALQMLTKSAQDEGIKRQIKLLQNLQPNEKLAIVQDLAPHLRANIVFPDGNSNKRIMVKGPVPIFYVDENNQGLPEFTPPGIKRGRDKDRVTRRDVKINPEPFLPAIRAHRYYSL